METLLNVKLTQAEADIVYRDFRKAFDSLTCRASTETTKHRSNRSLVAVTQSLFKLSTSVCQNGRLFFGLKYVLSGVQQGSPLLFVTFINDLPEYILSILFLFADDTKCLQIIKSLIEINRLQEDINNILHRSCNTNLLFNELKFIHLHFWLKFPTMAKQSSRN